MPGPNVAKGKAVVGYSLPKKLIKRIGKKAVDEGKRPCHVAERLLCLGLEAEAIEAKAEAPTSAN